MLRQQRVMSGFVVVVSLFLTHNALTKEVPYTLEDRDRLIRVEERMVTKEELKAEIRDVRNELKAEINYVREEMKEFMLWGFGITFAGIFALIGFVLWDRRTALSPAIRKSKELEEREERIERALKEAALKDENIKEALRQVGLL